MRKNMLMLLAAALLVVTGCKKDNNTENNNGEKMIFTATIDNGAKTQINGYDQVWNTGDEVSINGGKFTVTPKAGDESWATFEGQSVTPDEEGKYKAIFPSSLCNGNVYELPATQTYDGNNLSGVNPLYAESTTQELVFHNICALMKLNLKGNGTDEVTEIKVSADQALSGCFTVKERGEGYFAELVTSGGSADVTLMCDDGVALTAEGTTFYIAIPEYDGYSNLTFTATTSEGKTWTYKAGEDGSISVAANYLYESTQTPEFVSPAPTKPAGALPGLFTVNESGKQVHFSQGNLYAKKDNGTWSWHFYDNQYGYNSLNSFCEGGCRVAEENDDEIDLFTWGFSTSTSLNPIGEDYVTSHPNGLDVLDYEHSSSEEGDDWGVAYCESNAVAVGTWRTLNIAEWQYLFDNHEKKWITVCGKTGCAIAPDGVSADDIMEQYDTDDEWETAQDAGIVFLPAAGIRMFGCNVNDVGNSGNYWSSSSCDDNSAYNVTFNFDDSSSVSAIRSYGLSVRLVTESK